MEYMNSKVRNKEITNALKEYQTLCIQDLLTEDEQERLIYLDNEYDFRNEIWDYLNADQVFNQAIKQFLCESGTNIDQLLYGGIAMASYLMNIFNPDKHLHAHDEKGYTEFGNMWLDSMEYNEQGTEAIKQAINRAFDNLASEYEKEEA